MNRNWTWLSLCIALIFLLNYILPSDLNNWSEGLNFSGGALLNDQLLSEETHWRYTNSEFGRRPLMVNILISGHSLTGLPFTVLFLLSQLIGYVICIWLISILSRQIHRQVLFVVSALSFLLCFPNIFLFTAHAHTYDDLYQYAGLAAGVIFAMRSQLLYTFVALTFACITRETSFLFLPCMAYLLLKRDDIHWPWSLIIPVATGLATLLFLQIYLTDAAVEATYEFTKTHRFSAWRFNFGSYSMISESVFYPLFVLGPFVYLAVIHQSELRRTPRYRILLYCFIYLAIVNTSLVLISARVSEARLLFPPLIFGIPLLAIYWKPTIQSMRDYLGHWHFKDTFIVAVAVLAVGLLFHPSVGGTGYFYRVYAVVWTVAFTIMVMATRGSRSSSDDKTLR